MKYNMVIDCAVTHKYRYFRRFIGSRWLRGRIQNPRLLACMGLFISGCGAIAEPAKTIHSEPLHTNIVQTLQPVNDSIRLAELWEQRNRQNFTSDYPLGAGDVVEVNVSGVDEFKNLTERITGEGILALPFIGRIEARGMTDKELRAEIRRRLEKNHVRDPQVSLFVKEFRSRQVAVIGAVQKPGLFNLSSSADTILGMISQAGGMTATAAERILFFPAEPAESDKAKEVISAIPVRLLNQEAPPLILKNVEPLVISLDGVQRKGQEKYLQMPARPGDIVMIPGAGEVLVQGWVEKPGAYRITPGLTLLGVVAAAGGVTFPADTGAVELIRTNSTGHKSIVTADLDGIKRGLSPDVTLREGDVVEVVSSNPRLFAWGFYRFFTTLVNVGANATIPIGR